MAPENGGAALEPDGNCHGACPLKEFDRQAKYWIDAETPPTPYLAGPSNLAGFSPGCHPLPGCPARSVSKARCFRFSIAMLLVKPDVPESCAMCYVAGECMSNGSLDILQLCCVWRKTSGFQSCLFQKNVCSLSRIGETTLEVEGTRKKMEPKPFPGQRS